MSTNIFNTPNAMATTAVATLTNGGINSHHHHNVHNGHHRHHSHLTTSMMDPNPAILFPTTPSAHSTNTPLAGGVTQNSPTTAFPFPPPSPGFLSGSSVSSTRTSSLNPHQHLQQQLQAAWMSSNSIQAALALQMQHSTIPATNGKLSKEYSTTSDNNNNELISMTHLPTKGTKFLLNSPSEHQTDAVMKNKPKTESTTNQSAFKTTVNSHMDSKEKLHFAQINLPGTNNNCSPKMVTNNCQQSNSNITWPSSEYKHSSSTTPSSTFMLPNSYGNHPNSTSSSSPTSYPPVGHLRQNPTSPSAFNFPHYLIPPIYSYYQQAAAAAAQSPTNHQQQQQNSPISPFFVPNQLHSHVHPHHPLPSPTTISSTTNNSVGSIFFHDSMFPNTPDHSQYHSKQQSFESSTLKMSNKTGDLNETSSRTDSPKDNQKFKTNLMQQIIDLTANRKCDTSATTTDSPPVVVDQTKSSNPSDSINNVGLKRKSPDCSNLEKSKNNQSQANNKDESNNNASSSTMSSSSSRKHRILKPPNINITECDLHNNGFNHSAFLPSPLYSQHLSNRVLSSPYTYLDHIPLSAPPIPPSHHNTNGNNKCFEFPSDVSLPIEQSTAIRGSSSSKDLGSKVPLHLINNRFHKTSSLSSSSILLKNNEKKSEIKTAFQVPQPVVSKSFHENQENRHNKDSSKTNTCQKKSLSQFPEYFRKGSTIKLGDGNLKKIEELLTEDFIESASRNDKFRVEQAEIISMKEKTRKGKIHINFLVGQPRVKVSLDSPIDQPFFVFQKGWSSCSPASTSKRYGLNCRRMTIGDIVITLTNKPRSSLASSSSSSSSSLISSSSSLSSSSANAIPFNGFPGTSFLGRCPPPAHSSAHHNKQQTGNGISNSALNLDSKRKIHDNDKNSDNNKPLIDTTSTVAADDEDEIDVENIDDDVDREDCQNEKHSVENDVPTNNSPKHMHTRSNQQ